jgi:excinuclease ABC subunit C
MLQTVFKYRTCALDIHKDDPKNTFFRPCLLHAVGRCSAPCANRISQSAYKKDIERFTRFLSSKRSEIVRELSESMRKASDEKEFEKAAIFRDQLQAIEKLDERSSSEVIWQSEVTIFAKDPSVGMTSLQKVLEVDHELRFIEAFDIAHLQGGETVGAKVAFMDGRPYKEGYRRYKIKSATNDDYMSMREVISRRYRDAGEGKELYPDLIVIDGGKGQLSAAMDAFNQFSEQPELVISIAKKEELLYTVSAKEPIRLNRNHEGLKLVQAIRDEAHRFAQHYHHFLRNKNTIGKNSRGV